SAGAGEIERLKNELRLDGRLRGWLETVAPAALAAFDATERSGDAERSGELEGAKPPRRDATERSGDAERSGELEGAKPPRRDAIDSGGETVGAQHAEPAHDASDSAEEAMQDADAEREAAAIEEQHALAE